MPTHHGIVTDSRELCPRNDVVCIFVFLILCKALIVLCFPDVLTLAFSLAMREHNEQDFAPVSKVSVHVIVLVTLELP